jgi:hypothetical protein
MNYAIIGCGLIGKKRLAGLPAGSKLAVACDTNLARAEELVKLAQTGRAVADFMSAVASPQVDAVIVATINCALAEVSAAAIRAGKHVIVEKPIGRDLESARKINAILSENLDESLAEEIHPIRLRDVPVEGCRVELRQNVNPEDAGIYAITDRYVDQTIFACERQCGFGPEFCQRI